VLLKLQKEAGVYLRHTLTKSELESLFAETFRSMQRDIAACSECQRDLEIQFIGGDIDAILAHKSAERDNTKEIGPKAPDGTRFPYGKWQVHSCVDTRTGECIERPKRENTYKGGKQAMVPASECEAVIHKVHTLGGYKGQERTWKDIAGAYHGIPQNLVKTYIKNCSCTSARAGGAAKRKRVGTAMWAPSAWFRVEADLIDMTEQPSISEGKVYSYILQIIDQKTLFTVLAPLETKTAREVSKHLYRWFVEHGVPQVLHTDNGGEFTGSVLVSELRRFFPSLCITTGASRKPWAQDCVEQAHSAVYSYLHHLREIHGDTFKGAELLPSVAHMHNTAVQIHKSESPMFQRDGRDNRLVNADTLVTHNVLPEDEYRRRFDPEFGIRTGQQDGAAMQICGGSDVDDSNTKSQRKRHCACSRSGSCSNNASSGTVVPPLLTAATACCAILGICSMGT
jgi:hypothetical protein